MTPSDAAGRGGAVSHTPGPWTVGEGSWNENGNVCYELVGVKVLCATDARLIAAAPDLLECLKNLVGLAEMRGKLHEYKSAVEGARLTIAKATLPSRVHDHDG